MNIFNFFKKDEKGDGKDPNNNNKNNSSSKPSSLKLHYETKETGELESLNEIIKNFKFRKIVFENYEEYLKTLHFLISKKPENKLYESEIDYIYEEKMKSLKKEVKLSESKLNKMKEIGKIFFGKQTFLEVANNNNGQNSIFSNNNLKIESVNTFLNVVANNCIHSGRWCYEVTLITNGSMQIGFGQYISIPQFIRQNGVGMDFTSYSYDGYKKMKWNKDKKDYGKVWDVGDVIGVCIDMDVGKIEYYLNGEFLGIAFDKVPKGPNVVFFPALTLTRGESCLLNFGQLPFKYEYKNYRSFDTPLTKINGIDSVISDLLKLWKNNILPLLFAKKIGEYQNLLLSYEIFSFISQYITDSYVFHQIILPFLVDMYKSIKEQKEFQFSIDKFIGEILKNFTDPETQKNVGYFIFEHLSTEILERSLRM